MNNTNNIATNVFEVNIYNSENSVRGVFVDKVDVKNLTIPIEFSFPIYDNLNLTEFIETYNMLSPFKYSEKVKKDNMVKKSNLSCVYWDILEKAWSKEGCFLSSIDNTHIRCSCNHLSAFSISFATPKLTIEAPLLENSTVKAER